MYAQAPVLQSSAVRLSPLALVMASIAPLLLTPAPALAQDSTVARGRVVDASSGVPLQGARLVRLWAGDTIRTGADGHWRVVIPESGGTLRVTSIGYSPREVMVSPGDTAVRVRLRRVARDLEQVTVTASRRLQRLADVPVATEVITRDDIARTGATDLASVLTEHVGIELQGTITASAGVMLQGLDAQRVLVLVDGQPIAGRISGQFDVSRISTAVIERVEVVKGPQSTLYGSEAMGGVINVITRDTEVGDLIAEAELLGGSHGRSDGSLTLTGSRGDFSWMVSGGRRYSEVAPGQGDVRGAKSERYDGLLAARWSPDENRSIELSLNAQEQDQRWRMGQLYFFGDDRHMSGRLSGEYRHGSHTVRPTLYVSRFDHLSSRSISRVPAPGGDDDRQQLAEAELVYGFASGAHSLDAGVEVRRDETLSDRLANRDRAIVTYEPFAQYTWNAGRLSLVPGIRMASSEQWGTHWSPRVAVRWQALAPLALRVSIGEGYRAPGFRELYLEFQNSGPGFSYLVRGNPDLKPESSRNISASAEWTGRGGFARLTAFDNRFDDFIETRVVGDSSGVQLNSYFNVGEGYTRGVELEGGMVYGPFTMDAGISLLDTWSASAGRELLGRPRHSGRLTIGWAGATGTRVSVTGVRMGRAPISLVGDGSVTHRDAFNRLDLRVAQLLPWSMELTGGVDNAFDATPANWPGFTGRQFYLGLRWSGGLQ